MGAIDRLAILREAVGAARPDPIQRLDPEGCGCTDCMTGYSKPLDLATLAEKRLCALGGVLNASGRVIQIMPVVFIDGVAERGS